MPPVHYQPDGFPPENRLDWRRLIPLIGPTAAAVARYDSLLRTVPNAHATLTALRIREAVSSSRIENIFTSVAEVLETDAGLEPATPTPARTPTRCSTTWGRSGGRRTRSSRRREGGRPC